MLKSYLKKIHRVAGQGDAREESYYSTLELLLQDVAQSLSKPALHITTLPKTTEAGNPDFRIWNGRDRIVGYIEEKAPSTESLDDVEDYEQLLRYRATFPNLILTNYFEFRLYRNGQLVETVRAGRPYVLNRLGETPPVENEAELYELLGRFLSFSVPRTLTADELATELARRTRFFRDIVLLELEREQEDGPGALLGFYEAFKTYLIADLTLHDYADLYAQTITYGLFAARTRSQDGFTRRRAFDNIPHTIGILRDVFRYISLEELPQQLEWMIDDISEVLAVADAREILSRYFHDGKGSDPIVHFYETFLAKYDPEERERRGVYYTPEPVVSYIVRSLHHILKETFGKKDGLADRSVTLLDPAAGTMTFVAAACREAVREYVDKYGSGSTSEFIRSHILEHFFAFELMMAPYAVGHLKMSFFLEELGHRLADDERMKFFLTNTLDMKDLEKTHIPGMSSLSVESHLAGEVKKDKPILVILGNPPYSGHSVNRGQWIVDKIEDYKTVDGRPLGEKNPKWLQDDYVKFIRFAQWKIDQAGAGVVGMITNHAYIDNPTFRGMRRSLMNTFDDIFVLDLHGNSLKKEKSPDGSHDKNVFDIRQGVAILFLIKTGGGDSQIRCAERWGMRDGKYSWLADHNISSTAWDSITPQPPFYLFKKHDFKAFESFQKYPSVTELFPVNSVGIVTSRDHFVIDFDRDRLERRIHVFRHETMPDDWVQKALKLKNTKSWSFSESRQKVINDNTWNDHITTCLYRPFDIRWLFYHDAVIDRGRQEVMRHMMEENVAISTVRNVESGYFTHIYCSTDIITHHTVSVKEVNYLFPLYLYPATEKDDLFAAHESGERRPNLSPLIVKTLAEAYGGEPSPEDILHYIYAVLYAPSYREAYDECLKIDFPRIPFAASRELFYGLSTLGRRLAGLHLLRSDELDAPVARFDGEGDCRVAKSKASGFRYDEETGRVWINRGQYFGPVPPECWEYRIGGYQVLEKWLKDRKERTLTIDDIQTYCRIVTAIGKTIEIQQEIDELYPGVEESVVSFQ